MFSVVNVYFYHLKLCIVCINGWRYICCSEYNVVSHECNDPTACLVQPIGTHGVMYFGCVCFRSELGVLYSDDICICEVNKEFEFELLEFVFDSVYVDLQYDEIYLTFTVGYVSLCCVCSHVVVFSLSLMLSWYPMCVRWFL